MGCVWWPPPNMASTPWIVTNNQLTSGCAVDQNMSHLCLVPFGPSLCLFETLWLNMDLPCHIVILETHLTFNFVLRAFIFGCVCLWKQPNKPLLCCNMGNISFTMHTSPYFLTRQPPSVREIHPNWKLHTLTVPSSLLLAGAASPFSTDLGDRWSSKPCSHMTLEL